MDGETIFCTVIGVGPPREPACMADSVAPVVRANLRWCSVFAEAVATGGVEEALWLWIVRAEITPGLGTNLLMPVFR